MKKKAFTAEGRGRDRGPRVVARPTGGPAREAGDAAREADISQAYRLASGADELSPVLDRMSPSKLILFAAGLTVAFVAVACLAVYLAAKAFG